MNQSEAPRILKANALRELGEKMAFSFDDFNESCDAHLARVRNTAEELIRKAAAEADGIRKSAWEEGYSEGHEQGTQKAAEKAAQEIDAEAAQRTQTALAQALPALKQVSVELKNERDRWMSDWETLGVNLAVEIAGKILKREVAANPGEGVKTMHNLLEMVAGQPEIEVRMHSQDITILEQHQIEMGESLQGLGHLQVRSDDTITPGGCLVRTRTGELDARLETQLERITSELLQRDDNES